MKKLLFTNLILLVSVIMYSQNAEFYYFKANLSCCQARACNALEGELKSLIETSFPKGDVKFKTIMIADENNKDIINKYQAKSQTCILIVKKRNSEFWYDMTPFVKKYQYAKEDEKKLRGQELVLEIQKNIKLKKKHNI